jgi:hypothetical protein
MISVFCVVFLVDTLCVLYPVLRVFVLCFWFIRCVSCIQHDVFLCFVLTQKHVILDTRQTTYTPKTQHRNTYYWIQDTQRINQSVSCIQYYVFLCCVFGLYVVCLVSSITCFCVLFLVYTFVSCIQYYMFLCCVLRNTGYETNNV